MSTRGTVRLATRGSDLALRQAERVREALTERRYAVELVEVETRGDRIRDELIHRLGRTGAFVRALDERVLAGEVDGAVHSMKDMPTDQPSELVVAGVPDRAPAGDVLVTPDGTALEDLPDGATVGTSSLRRKAQLLDRRPDLTVRPLRGNVDTRVEKLLAPHRQREHRRRVEAAGEGAGPGSDEGGDAAGGDTDGNDGGNDRGENDDGDEGDEVDGGSFDRTPDEWFDALSEIERRSLEREVDVEYDAIVLAEAGLSRSGLLRHLDYERLPPGGFVPAPGQGAIAVTAVDGDAASTIHDALDHPRTRVETTVERTVLAELGGGCVAPIGVHAVLQGEYVHAAVRVLSADGSEVVEGTRDLPVERHAQAAVDFAADLAERGAADLIADARREAEDTTADHLEDEE